MSTITQIDSPNAPKAVGPYSQAISLDNLIFVSGALPIDPATKAMPDEIKAQATQALTNLKAILETGGSGMNKVVKALVFLTDMNDFAAVNEIYSGFFGKPFPARSCIAVKALPLGAKVEIEVIAAK